MGKASNDPVQGSAKATKKHDENSVNAGLLEMAQLARQSFEEKRRKQALAIANAILKIEPEHKDALVISSWVRGDLQRDFDTAVTLVEDARNQKNRASYERAERLLRSILLIDEDERAKALLAEVLSEQVHIPPAAPRSAEPLTVPPAPMHLAAVRRPRRRLWTTLPLLAIFVGVVFALIRFGDSNDAAVVQPHDSKLPDSSNAPRGDGTRGSVELFVVPSTGVQVSVDDAPAEPVQQTLALPAGPHRLSFTANGYQPETISQTIEPGKQHVLPVIMRPLDGNAPDKPSAPAPAPENEKRAASQQSAPPTAARSNAPAERRGGPARAAVPMGTLVVSSAVPAEVYLDTQHLGTMPLQVQLPTGLQTLEYRYQGMQKTLSHLITADETTTASIAFEVDVQINAKPWAQILIQGPPQRVLGQTPLSNIKLAVGTVLLFQNPSFPEKRYVVTGKEQAIQITFP